MDTIVIQDLEVRYRVGVPETERANPQRLLLSLNIGSDFHEAAIADDLTKTIDYYAVTRRLLALGNDRSWRLIETLAEEIAGIVLREYGAAKVMVEIKKFILPEARHVGVRIERSRVVGFKDAPLGSGR